MKTPRTRREFLTDVGRGMLVATVGAEAATHLGLSSVLAEEAPAALSFGSLEPLVCLLQETPANQLLPILTRRLRTGTSLRELVSAAALANARTFGGEDYVGFHTLMALAPSYHMANELPIETQPLPVFKVLYRNTQRILEHGGRNGEVLHPVAHPAAKADQTSLREAVRKKDAEAAERAFATLAKASPQDALDSLLFTVQDQTEVHRVVLPYRAWDLLDLVGRDNAHTLLRQSVRYCVRAESWSRPAGHDDPRSVLPQVLEEYGLLDKSTGDRSVDDAWVEKFSETLFNASPRQAAAAAASALREGISPAAVGEAITLTANQLVLRDTGRTARDESPGKPMGSVHGDSIGVHACDSANAWRNLARVGNTRNCFSSLILGAYQVALDRTARGGDFVNWRPLPFGWQADQAGKLEKADELLRETDEAIRGNLQARASALVHRYGELRHDPRNMFDLMLRYAVSEDGALHAEKFYRTSSEEFSNSRPGFRWRYLVALARVTASEYGRPAAGMAEARELLKTS